LVQPVEAIGELCAGSGVPYLVDACQAVGQLPVDAEALHCDFLAASARKFLRGPRGIGFLFVSERALEEQLQPLYLDMLGADWVGPDRYQPREDARRFENWEFPYALVLGMGVAIEYAMDVGVEVARNRSWRLAQTLRDALAGVRGVRVLDRGPELCAIVTVVVEGYTADALVEELRIQGINTSALDRVSAVIDLDEKGVSSALRLSPHYYNTESEVRAAVAAIRSVVEAP
jgi:selenocysteine lyase/cysteine desulfurase